MYPAFQCGTLTAGPDGIRYPLSLRQVEDLLFERGIDLCHETVRFWWNRVGPMFTAEIRKRRVFDLAFGALPSDDLSIYPAPTLR